MILCFRALQGAWADAVLAHHTQAAADWNGNVDATLYESFDRSVIVDVMHCTQPCKICDVSCSTGPTVAKTLDHPNLKLDRFGMQPPTCIPSQASSVHAL